MSAETSAQLHDLVESHSRGNTPKASAGSQAEGIFGSAHGHQMPETASGADESDLDADLEAYLQTIAHDKKEQSNLEKTGEGDSESAADLEDYLNELKTGDSEGDDHEDEDAVDVEEYMQGSDGSAEPTKD